MLIEFSVENFRSIKNKQTLSLVTSNLSENKNQKDNIFSINNISLLKVAFIYGANASGKSNLIMALDIMDQIVRKSASVSAEVIPVIPFLLDDVSVNEPTEFEIIFIQDGIKYQYGFSVTKERICDEWLFAFPKGKPQLWFTREYDIFLEVTVWEYGSNFKGNKKVWEQATRDNALFLSTAIQLNSEILKPVSEWFKEKLIVNPNNRGNSIFSKKYCESVDDKLDILNFMKAADLGIEDFSLKKEEIEIHLPDDIPSSIKELISWDRKNKIRTIHQTDSGKSVSFDLEEDESEGTQRLFSMSALFLSAYKKGATIFIDELDCSLHPQILYFIISQFCNTKINKSNAQLIFTTHDVSLLSPNSTFRWDQVWFVNKNEKQESELYPLTDFRIRKDMKFEKAYLSGRFGAVPNISFDYFNNMDD
jgi:uncharacterized protein